MNPKLAAILLILVLFAAGCSINPNVGTDQQTMQVVWHRVNNVHSLCQRLTGRQVLFGKVRGCAIWNKQVCHIYAPDFKNIEERERMATLGHELKHCFDGQWHH